MSKLRAGPSSCAFTPSWQGTHCMPPLPHAHPWYDPAARDAHTGSQGPQQLLVGPDLALSLVTDLYPCMHQPPAPPAGHLHAPSLIIVFNCPVPTVRSYCQGVCAAMKLKMLTPWKASYNQPRQHIKKQRHYFANKCPSSQGYDFSSSHV